MNRPPSPMPSAPTWVVAAVCLVDDAGRVLTVRKAGTAAFMLPGGKLEPGESALDAARREVREEVALDVGDLEPLGRFVADAANEPGHLVDSTVFRAACPGHPSRSGEIAELHWLDVADPVLPGDALLAPLLAEHVLPRLLAGREHGR